ncbi:hypothetical protein DFH06DRAFT_1344885 [Mycena polygramma]|nr:hypothetical protein DFH06DRAFT_1344885 [Mycena polygramma]
MTIMGFFTEEQQREYEKAFPGENQSYNYRTATAPMTAEERHPHQQQTSFSFASGEHAAFRQADTAPEAGPSNSRRNTEDESMGSTDYEDEDDGIRVYPRHRRRRRVPSPPSTPEPPRMQAPAQATFNAPLRTSLDMPVRGSKEAPKTFKGKHTTVQLFVEHYDHLLNKCRVTMEKEKCEFILSYCSIDVQNVLRTMEGYRARDWARLRKEILRHFDAERALQKYKPADVKKFAMKMRTRSCYNLTQWRKYFVKYNAIAGGPLHRKHLSQEDYYAFFQIGIHRPLRQVLENRILQSDPYRGDEEQYTIKEWNRAAEWYFRRDKYETLMIGADELGEGLDDGDSGDEFDDDSSSSEDFDSDYEEFRRKKKLHAKKKKDEQRRKASGKKPTSEGEKQKYQGNEDEIAGMIRKLNAMRLDDPDYAPIYYKVMVLDQSGTAKQCVKAPVVQRGENARSTRVTASTSTTETQSPATYPNNIPVPPVKPGAARGGDGFKGCYGCQEEGHRIFDCRAVGDLVRNNVITFNEETRKLTMKNGDMIRRNPGESLVQAAARIAKGSGPRVMMMEEEIQDRAEAVGYFYQQTENPRILEIVSEDEEESDYEGGSLEEARTQQEELESFWNYAANLNKSEQFVLEEHYRAQQGRIPASSEQWQYPSKKASDDDAAAVAAAQTVWRDLRSQESESASQQLALVFETMNTTLPSTLRTPAEPEVAPPALPAMPYVSPFSTTPYEEVQYLSRQSIHHPPPQALMLAPQPNDAISSIQGVLHEQWGKYLRREPADVTPAFTAAPQSKYVGCYERPDGQLVHRSIAMNSLEVLTNEQTGLPYSIVGHTVRDTYAAPASNSTVWPLELFYPTSERLHDAMSQCLREPPDEGDSGFPIHATPECPPLPGFHDSMTVQQGNPSLARDAANQFTRRYRQEGSLDVPSVGESASLGSVMNDAPRSRPPMQSDEQTASEARSASSLSPQSEGTASSMPSLVPLPPIETELRRLNRDIAARARQDLIVDDSLCGDRSHQESVTDDLRMDESLGICDICFEPEHPPWRPCSATSPQTPPYMIPGHPLTPPRLDATVLPDDDSDEDEHEQRQREADRAVKEALRPILEDFVNLPFLEGEALDHIAFHAQEMREAFEDLIAALEARRTEGRTNAAGMERELNATRSRIGSLQRRDAQARATGLSAIEAEAAEALRALSTHATRPSSNASPLVRPTTPAFDAPQERRRPISSGANAVEGSVIPEDPRKTKFFGSPQTDLSEYSYEEFDLYARTPDQPRVNTNGVISPAVTEWSVSSSDFDIEPERIIDEAIYRVRAQQEEASLVARANASREARGTLSSLSSEEGSPADAARFIHPFDRPDHRSEQDRMPGHEGQALVATVAPTFDHLVDAASDLRHRAFRYRTAKEQFNELCDWMVEGRQGQNEALQWEDNVHGEPIREALKVLHGPLARFVDYPAMASESLAAFRGHAPLDIHSRSARPDAVSPPNLFQSPTSLDFSLPDRSSPLPSVNTMQSDNTDEGFVMEPLHTGRKRERPPVSAAEEEMEARRRRKFPTGLAEADVVRLFAGIRRGFLEGFQRIEDLVWARYDVSQVRDHYQFIAQYCDNTRSTVAYQDHFPVGLIRHAMLCDSEAARMQVIYEVLRDNNRHVLATLLADILTLRLRDTYAVSQLLNAGYLDTVYPPELNNYWELLGDPDSDSSDTSEDSSVSELGYLPSNNESLPPRGPSDVCGDSRPAEDIEAPVDDRSSHTSERDGGGAANAFVVHGHPPGQTGGCGICLP